MKLIEYVSRYPRTFNHLVYPEKKEGIKWNQLKGRQFIEAWDKAFNLKPIIITNK